MKENTGMNWKKQNTHVLLFRVYVSLPITPEGTYLFFCKNWQSYNSERLDCGLLDYDII